MKTIYLIGSLRAPKIPEIGNSLRKLGFDVFDDWWAASEDADDWWMHYEKGRGHSYADALNGLAAQHVYDFDKFHLDRDDIGVLVLPCGKSGHLELGYLCGKNKPTYVLFAEGEPERYDVMYKLCTSVHFSLASLEDTLKYA